MVTYASQLSVTVANSELLSLQREARLTTVHGQLALLVWASQCILAAVNGKAKLPALGPGNKKRERRKDGVPQSLLGECLR